MENLERFMLIMNILIVGLSSFTLTLSIFMIVLQLLITK